MRSKSSLKAFLYSAPSLEFLITCIKLYVRSNLSGLLCRVVSLQVVHVIFGLGWIVSDTQLVTCDVMAMPFDKFFAIGDNWIYLVTRDMTFRMQ